MTYSEQLFEAYMKGRKIFLMFQNLADDVAEKNTLTTQELHEVRFAAKTLNSFFEKWNKEVVGILDKINDMSTLFATTF